MNYIISCDGGFLTKETVDQYYPDNLADAVHAWLTREIPEYLAHKFSWRDAVLLRAYYYDCYPMIGKLTNPFSGKELFMKDDQRKSFLHDLATLPSICLRTGKITHAGWRLSSRKIEEMKHKSRMDLFIRDFEPFFVQKGVDTKLTLDALQLVMQGNVPVHAMVFITGDSDFAPLFDLLRQYGVRVILAPLGGQVQHMLLASVDDVLDVQFNTSSIKGKMSKSIA